MAAQGTRAAHARGHATFSSDELQRFAADLRLELPSFADFLDVLNQQSYLLRIGPREWRLATSSH